MFALGNVEPKLRAYQPYLQSLCEKDKNPHRAVQVLQEMIARNVIPSGDDLKMLLIVAQLTNSYSNLTLSMELNRVIDALSVHLVGFMSTEAVSLVSSYRNITREEVEKEGVLVQDIGIIREFSEMILSDSRSIDGTVTALNASFTRIEEVSSKSGEGSNISLWKDLETGDVAQCK